MSEIKILSIKKTVKIFNNNKMDSPNLYLKKHNNKKNPVLISH